jgi:predicted enzyme related to lactoylglutathione lyase
MGERARHAPGTIAWTDLTVPDAEKVRDFYAAVVGWRIVSGPRALGEGRCCVIEDPAGAVCALYQQAS